MKVYIARGPNAWTASLEKGDAVLRVCSWLGPKMMDHDGHINATLISTDGEWNINSIDGNVSSSREIHDHGRVTREDYLCAASAYVSRIASGLEALGFRQQASILDAIVDFLYDA